MIAQNERITQDNLTHFTICHLIEWRPCGPQKKQFLPRNVGKVKVQRRLVDVGKGKGLAFIPHSFPSLETQSLYI